MDVHDGPLDAGDSDFNEPARRCRPLLQSQVVVIDRQHAMVGG
jgi:hypothetical protein